MTPWRLRIVLALPLAVIVAACSPSSGEKASHPPPPPSTSTSAVPSASASATLPLALWPETDRSVAPATYPTWRASAESTTGHFAAAVLRWPAPVVRSIRSQFHVEPGVRTFAVSPRVGAHAIEVHAARVFDEQHWSVTYLWGFGAQETPASVSIARARGEVTVGYWNHSASARLLVAYGRHQVERVASSSAHWTFPVTFPINVGGAVIVLFTDASGEVFTGWGTALSAGPVAAG